MTTLSELFTQQGLQQPFSFLQDPSEFSAVVSMPEEGTYHSIQHARAVAETAVRLAEATGIPVLHLAVAGIFHDAGHSRNAAVPDEENIEVAVRIWHDFARLRLPVAPPVDADHVELLLRSTLSSSSPGNSSTEEERILYDADTLASLFLPVPLEDFQHSLEREGCQQVFTPQAFVRHRGLYSLAALKRYSHLLRGKA